MVLTFSLPLSLSPLSRCALRALVLFAVHFDLFQLRGVVEVDSRSTGDPATSLSHYSSINSTASTDYLSLALTDAKVLLKPLGFSVDARSYSM